MGGYRHRFRGPTGWLAGRLGQTTVEFTLTALVALLPLGFGLLEIGRGVWTANQLAQLAREGARWVVVTANRDVYDQAGNRPGAYNLAACGCADDSAVGWMRSRAVGLARGQVTATIAGPPVDQTYTYGATVTVTLTYPYRPVVTDLLNIPATIPLRATTTMYME